MGKGLPRLPSLLERKLYKTGQTRITEYQSPICESPLAGGFGRPLLANQIK